MGKTNFAPNGKIVGRSNKKSPQTVNYKTLKPEKDGLFCELDFLVL
jgi:DNA-directed RNA polymerase beta' subunit